MRDLGPIVVPWDFDGDLARAYREGLEVFRGRYEWLGFMDCDVEIMCRDYAACVRRAVAKFPNAGLIAGRVNLQHAANVVQSLGIKSDLDSAGRLAVQHRLRSSFGYRAREIVELDDSTLISGCWFYVHIERAIAAGAFDYDAPMFFGVDQIAHERLHEAGHRAIILDGVFVFHRYHNIERRHNRGHLGQTIPETSKRRGEPK